MLGTRLLSGIVLLAIIITANLFGGVWLWLLVSFLSIVGLYEYYRAVGIRSKKRLEFTGIGFALAYDICLFAFGLETPGAILGVTLLFFVAMLAIFVFSYPKVSANELFSSVFGFFYVVLMLSFIYLTRLSERGTELVWLIFIASWGSDTLAYCAGRLFGKHKLAPVLSPKKTIEGAVGGVVGAGLLGLLYGLWAGEAAAFAVLSAAGSLVSQVGDLAASGIKRNFDIKDYGKLIPGHGGILDRFDSVIITAPLVFLLSMFMIGI